MSGRNGKKPAKRGAKRTRRTLKKPRRVAMVVSHPDPIKMRALRAYTIAGTVKRACLAAKVGRSTWYDWMEADPVFAKAVVDAAEEVTDELEEEAVERAKHGSDTLLIFLLKSKRPQQYRERQEITVVSSDVKARLVRQAIMITDHLGAAAAEPLLTMLDAVWS